MALDTDFHSHVARSSAYEMAQSAREKGIHILGLSEHIFQMREARPFLENLPLEGPLRPFSAYTEAVHMAAQQTHIDVRLGLEVDFIPEKDQTIQRIIQDYPWDFLIGSVHQIDDVIFERDLELTREQGEALWLRYFQLLRQAVISKNFSVVSHPVRMGYTNPYVPSTLDDELEQLAAEATRCDVALELNGTDIKRYPSLVQRLAKACALHQTSISVGSDAHMPHQVARSHAQTITILREAGISTIRIWKQRIPEEYRF